MKQGTTDPFAPSRKTTFAPLEAAGERQECVMCKADIDKLNRQGIRTFLAWQAEAMRDEKGNLAYLRHRQRHVCSRQCMGRFSLILN